MEVCPDYPKRNVMCSSRSRCELLHVGRHEQLCYSSGYDVAVQMRFPNVVLLLRDAAHALRIAVKDPLHRDALFGDVWNSLFAKRHALVPDNMNSPKWQDLLQNIQNKHGCMKLLKF